MGCWSRGRREDSVFEEMDASRSDPCGATFGTQGEDGYRGKGHRLGLCQSGDWKTILARGQSGKSEKKFNPLERSPSAREIPATAPYLFEEHPEGKKGKKILVPVRFSREPAQG